MVVGWPASSLVYYKESVMLRKLDGHKVSGCNEALELGVLDEPGCGGANHKYVIYVPNDEFNEELNASLCVHLNFQDGPVKESGVNGITHEALLAVLIDRLEGFQRGPFACVENQNALIHLNMAADNLKTRTLARVARGVEGTNEV